MVIQRLRFYECDAINCTGDQASPGTETYVNIIKLTHELTALSVSVFIGFVKKVAESLSNRQCGKKNINNLPKLILDEIINI